MGHRGGARELAMSAHLGASRRIFGPSSPQMALGGAGVPLPDCIEDSFLSWLTRLVMLGWLWTWRRP